MSLKESAEAVQGKPRPSFIEERKKSNQEKNLSKISRKKPGSLKSSQLDSRIADAILADGGRPQ